MGQGATGDELPPDVLLQLRRTFAREAAERLVRLRAAADFEAVRRDAHSLATSAWIVGELEVSRLARQAEEQMEEGAVADLALLVAALVAALESALRRLGAPTAEGQGS